MSNDSPLREAMFIEEGTVSSMWKIAESQGLR
jgi:hypothetical protein